MKTVFRVLRFLRGFELVLFLSVICNTLYSLLTAASIAIIQPILQVIFNQDSAVNIAASIPVGAVSGIKDKFYYWISTVVVSPDKQVMLFRLSLFIIAAFVAKNIFKYLGANLNTRLGEGIVKSMRDTLFMKMVNLSMDFFNRSKAGDLMSLVTNDISVMHGSITPLVVTLFREPIQIIIMLFMLISFSPELTLLAFSTSIFSLIIIRTSTKYIRRYASRMQKSTANFTSVLQETTSGIRAVKSTGAESHAVRRFTEETYRYVRSAIKNQKVVDLVPSINDVLAIVALSTVLYVGGLQVFAGKMNGSDLMAFLFLLFGIMSPVSALAGIPSQVQRGLVASERVFAVIDSMPGVVSGNKILPEFTSQLEVKNLTFSYHEHPVLKDVSFTIPKSKKIAFVGPSGGGKSTMVDTIIRFYDPQQGELLIDGTNIREFTLESYRSLFGIVSQESILFNDTVAGNIALGAPDATREEIEQAAKIANAHDFIMKLPEGYDSIVGDRGVLLSGGQKQRIAIARAVVRQPQILIFDEATSALDSESEKAVQEAVNRVLENRTAIIIAHRLSTILDADEIFVFDGGRIVERGNHSQLLALGGTYRRLYDIQFSNQKDREEITKEILRDF
ncbi:MAG: ABC transporter ATP-binding protein [Ignavibacteriae bacterium]|nr:ABC transporter ATP-binding protein [Ignavibacteriota bacterium]